jgi:hypothetical protein
MKVLFRPGAAIAVILSSSLPALGHHSSASFEDNRSVRMQATVTRVKWANPHVYIEVESSDGQGNPVEWLVEGLPPTSMRSAGWERDSLAAGDEVIVVGYPARNPEHRRILGDSIITPDGNLLPIPTSKDRSRMPAVDLDNPLVAEDLSGRWQTRWTPLVATQFMRPHVRWQLTEKGLEAMESYGPLLDPSAKCVPEPSPYVMIWPSGKHIEITDEMVTIRDELGVERIVHMKVDTHEGAEYSDQGHSIGRWEGDALVVDTTHFVENRRGLAVVGVASSRQKHLVERFQLSPDRTTLEYSFWVEDPVYLEEPVAGELTLVYRPDLPFIIEPCDLESASRHLDH